MIEAVKNRIILILSILTVVFFITTINSCTETQRQKQDKNREIFQRMELEEKSNKLSQEKSNLQNKLNNLQQETEELKAKLDTTQKALLQEELINKSLKEELDKITKLKDRLEEDLKEALTKSKGK